MAIDLFSSPYLMSLTWGVLDPGVPSLVYRGNAEINGTLYRSLIQPIPGGRERILGRDMLNQIKVTSDGPRHKAIFWKAVEAHFQHDQCLCWQTKTLIGINKCVPG